MTVLRVAVPVADLLRDPGGARDRQLLMGEAVRLQDERDGWVRAEALRDGYPGWMRRDVLADLPEPNHRVSARATHLYSEPDLKSRERASLSLGSLLEVTGRADAFAETPQGFVPAGHLAPLDTPAADPVAVAERLIGTPYLWGGNSAFGIDCSGLVQIACLACAIACPGDSDEQAAELGHALPEGTPPLRGDLLFWAGHVAWVADAETLIHANARDMAVAYEPLQQALARIEAQGDGCITHHKRLEQTR
ncbi:NlpC/P60 family protein [Roseovarius amoyensis]|uniref:C40 family peptidase n=1 Tax=Roseovarius amoyensis TaxID=2211448 RepID=UPI000DBE0D7F|nr:NlpC/P60 family protein [Roseovarius amoyensis]